MDIRITPSKLIGSIAAIPSKSDLHRALICAALSEGPCTILLSSPAILSKDMAATIRCLEALGAEIRLRAADRKRSVNEDSNESGIESYESEKSRNICSIEITPIRTVPEHPVLRCGESGSTLRFLLPVAAYLCDNASFEGEGRLP